MRVETPLGRLPAAAVVVANAAFWPAWTAAVGWLAARTPDSRFCDDDLLTRGRAWERDGAWYRDRLRIHRWKDHLPERGAAFGGFAKTSVASGDDQVMGRFVLETRRAEHAHWGMLGGVVLTAVWNPWWAFPANLAVAAGSNLPCIAVQRYNRARLQRVARRRTVTSGR